MISLAYSVARTAVATPMLVPGGAVNFLAQRCFSAGAIVNVEASVAALVAAAVIVPSSGMRAGDFGSVDMFASASVRCSCTKSGIFFVTSDAGEAFTSKGRSRYVAERVRGGGTRRRYEGALIIRPFRIPGFDVDQVEQTVFTRTPRRSKLASSCSQDLSVPPLVPPWPMFSQEGYCRASAVAN